MGQITLQVPQVGLSDATEDPKVASDMVTIQATINGQLDATNITAGLAQSAGVNRASQTIKGAISIPAAQTTSSSSFTTLATPDQITGITLAATGIIRVRYWATWNESVAGAARAAIFIGGNQLSAAVSSSSANAQQVPVAALINGPGGNPTGVNIPLTSYSGGLASTQQISNAGAQYGGDVSTGQIVGIFTANQFSVDAGGSIYTLPPPATFATHAGGACDIWAAAGTYTVGVRFKASSGLVTALNRRLWVEAISFG